MKQPQLQMGWKSLVSERGITLEIRDRAPRICDKLQMQ